jgi:hypothetical protein
MSADKIHEPSPEAAGARKRLVEVRCGFAEMAHKEAATAEDRAREARARHDARAAALSRRDVAIDPVATKAAKERAHEAFRKEVKAARTRSQVEASAGVWLDEINRLNGLGRAAQVAMKREREEVEALLFEADHLADTAEASRAMADSAAEACRSARAALAAADDDAAEALDSQRAASRRAHSRPSTMAPPPDSASAMSAAVPPAPAPPAAPAPPVHASVSSPTWVPGSGPNEPEAKSASDWLAIDLRSPHPQAVVRLMRRDRRAMNSLVDRLAGTDPATRSRFQLLLSTFVDSVVAAAIDDAWFEFPAGNPFWDLFTPSEAREVARGLAALGFRYDGFGAFANDRVPGQRDLALAVGSAGLLPDRIRFWPKPEEAAELFREVRVAADDFLAARAAALTLGELVRLLGRRAESLAELWNDWSRVRPLLFSTAD